MIFRSRKRRAETNDDSVSDDSVSDDAASDDAASDDAASDDAASDDAASDDAASDDAASDDAASDDAASDDAASDDAASDDAVTDDSVGDESLSDDRDTGGDGQDLPTDETQVADDAGIDTDDNRVGPVDQVDQTTNPDDKTAPAAVIEADSENGADEADGADEAEDELSDAEQDELDAQHWRDLGPYDIREVDAESLEDAASEDTDQEQEYVDLGSMVLPTAEDSELRLQIDEDSQQIVSAMMINDDSALEVGAFAAPGSGGLWSEIRPEMLTSITENAGSADLVAGPFGVELRRLIPVETPDGEQGYQPSRMWVAEGPRWMLRGIVYGEAALTEGIESPVAELLELFRKIVIRRGDEPMAPGDLLPLNLPESLAEVDTADADDAPDSDSADDEGG